MSITAFLCVILSTRRLSWTSCINVIYAWHKYAIFSKFLHNNSSNIYKFVPIYILPVSALSDITLLLVVLQNVVIILCRLFYTLKLLILHTAHVWYLAPVILCCFCFIRISYIYQLIQFSAEVFFLQRWFLIQVNSMTFLR